MQQSILYLTFLSLDFIDTVLVTVVDIVFVIFVSIVFVTLVDTLSITITEASVILFKYLTFSQIHVLGFQL